MVERRTLSQLCLLEAYVTSLTCCRIMRPDDANVAGNVHGGTILKMIEEAGVIISTRHCNSQNGVSVGPTSCGPGSYLGLGSVAMKAVYMEPRLQCSCLACPLCLLEG